MKVNRRDLLNGDRGCGLVGRHRRRRSWVATELFCPLLLSLVLASQAAAAPVHPLKKSANGRYLVDQNNTPYLITGDSPQALIVNLSEADALTFLANRSTNGFNTVWINLLCNTYTGGRTNGSTLDGILPFINTVPFTSSYDLTTPNEAYFAHVDRVLELAAQQGLLVLFDPIETGGWLNTILDNGTNRCRAYGQYLGNRYQNFDNIIWLSGNDYTQWSSTNVDAVVRQVALGIQDNDSRHLHTVELGYPVSSSLDDSSWVPIIALNATYTYRPTYAQVLVDYNRASFLPTFMVEANYEFENDWINNATGRRQEYWSLLSGACGQLYGNHFTWQFLTNWPSHLDTAGSTQLGYVKALFAPRRWYDLVPDLSHALVPAGYGTFATTGSVNNSDYATVAGTADGTLAMVYMPTLRTVTVDLSKLAGPVKAQWYDPASGMYTAIPGSPFANSGTQTFTPTGNNADGNGDWVLLLEDSTPPTPFQTWQLQYFGCTNLATCPQAAATADPDGDGQNNQTEFLTGTNPTNNASSFRIVAVAREGNNIRVTWSTSGGGTNLVEAASSPTGSYSSLTANMLILGIGEVTTNYVDVGGATKTPARFYRVRWIDGTPVLTPFQAWQMAYFNCTNCPQAAATADPDGDGQNNLAEFVAGTNPTNSASAFRIVLIGREGNNIRVTWKTSGGTTNVVEVGSTLTGGYSSLSPNILISGSGDATTNYVDVGGATNSPARFYRVRLIDGSALTVTPFQTWELAYFNCTNCPQAAATADPDGDGQNNLAEFMAGTNPNSSASVLRIVAVAQEGNNIRVTWKTGAGRTNMVEAASTLTGGYSNLSTNILISGSGDATTNYVDVGGATNAPARFYRVRLVAP